MTICKLSLQWQSCRLQTEAELLGETKDLSQTGAAEVFLTSRKTEKCSIKENGTDPKELKGRVQSNCKL